MPKLILPLKSGPATGLNKINSMISSINEHDSKIEQLEIDVKSGEPETIIVVKNGIAYYATARMLIEREVPN